MLPVVDTSPLYAAADSSDADDARSLAVLQQREIQLIIPALAVAEATYLTAELVDCYADFPLGVPAHR